ncbi:MAG: hypothetical protein Q9191_002145 [Dirinaria sp. TL-2023a]
MHRLSETFLLSASCFYYAFLAEEKPILQAVLFNEFGPALLSEALATYRASRLPGADVVASWQGLRCRSTDQFGLKDYPTALEAFEPARDELLLTMNNRPEVPDDWNLVQSLALANIHSDVTWFASEFGAYIMHQPERFIQDDHEPLTQSEMIRISFQDVAEHDVLWGKHKIGYNEDLGPPFVNAFKEHCLSLGLAWLRRLAMADTYDKRYQLLAPETGEHDPGLFTSIYENFDYGNFDIKLHDLTEGTVHQHIEPPFISDPDPGPFTAWFWAYQSESAAQTYAISDKLPLRRQGYVMIDYDRLQKRYSLEIPFEPVSNVVAKSLSVSDGNRKKVEESYSKRSDIYDAGGRGYWSEDGDSKLIWNISAPGDGMELTIDTRRAHYLDEWREGILVDRIRFDCYFCFY